MMDLTQQHARLCSSLADYHRLLIVYAVAEKTQNVSELVERLAISQPTVSRHLRILRDAGVVCARREGKSIYYATTDHRILQALELLRGVLRDRIQPTKPQIDDEWELGY